jgi:hypothetical protein
MKREGEAPSEPEKAARTEPRPPGNVIVLASLKTSFEESCISEKSISRRSSATMGG